MLHDVIFSDGLLICLAAMELERRGARRNLIRRSERANNSHDIHQCQHSARKQYNGAAIEQRKRGRAAIENRQ
jgi:hypothetical protein